MSKGNDKGKGKGKKLLAFNAALCLANVLLFSKAFIGLDLSGGNAFGTAFGIMAIVMSIVLFVLVNHRIIFPPPPQPPPTIDDMSIDDLDVCARALEYYIDNNSDFFSAYLRTTIGQIKRMGKRKATIRGILLERFSETELSFAKFQGAVDGVESIMLRNTRNLLKRINAFDEEEYEDTLKTDSAAGRLNDTRRAILREYTSFVSQVVEDNEEILLRLDRLILEVSKLSDIHGGDVDTLPAMREIDELISDTKWYK